MDSSERLWRRAARGTNEAEGWNYKRPPVVLGRL